jgi:hypothetical protein
MAAHVMNHPLRILAVAARFQVLLFYAAPSLAETVVVPVPSPYSYKADSVQPIVLAGRTDRYLQFVGHTVIDWPATPARLNPGNPGTIRCERQRCWQQGYSAPSLTGGTPAGSIRSFFTYRLDCRDRTFDRLGDVRVPASVPKGWQPVTNDPTALAVADRYCPDLTKQTGSI